MIRNPFRRHKESTGLRQAKEMLAEVRAREIDVDHAVTRVQEARQKNHFGPLIGDALKEAPR